MPTPHAFLALLLLTTLRPLATAAEPAKDGQAPTGWLLAAHGRVADLLVERQLYALPATPSFLLRFRIANRSADTVWVDLGSPRDLYPQQWGGIQTDHRDAVDERRVPRPALDAAARAAVIERLGKDRLTRIPVGGAVDVYRAFDGGNGPRVENTATPWLFVSTAGGCLVSDGTAVEDLSLEGDGFDAHDVVVPTPVVPVLLAPLPIVPKLPPAPAARDASAR